MDADLKKLVIERDNLEHATGTRDGLNAAFDRNAEAVFRILRQQIEGEKRERKNNASAYEWERIINQWFENKYGLDIQRKYPDAISRLKCVLEIIDLRDRSDYIHSR